MPKSATVRDVALRAGVSPATASRALNGTGNVNPEMVRRVQAAAGELGYTTNALARALRTQRTDTIGMVVPALSNAYFVAAVEAVEQVLADSGRSLIICDARDSTESEARRIDLLLQRMVDGLVVAPVHAFDSVPAIDAAQARVPTVMFDRWAASEVTDYVGVENAAGMQLLVDHLRRQGCRDIVYVGAHSTTSTAWERNRAFHTSLGLPSTAEGGEHSLLGAFSATWGEQAARLLLARPRLPEGIVCGADVIAAPLLGALRSAGVDIPGRVKVVSFDGGMLSRVTVPRLTAVVQPLADMAYEAVRILDARSAGPSRSVRKSIFPPALLVAGSSVPEEPVAGP